MKVKEKKNPNPILHLTEKEKKWKENTKKKLYKYIIHYNHKKVKKKEKRFEKTTYVL